MMFFTRISVHCCKRLGLPLLEQFSEHFQVKLNCAYIYMHICITDFPLNRIDSHAGRQTANKRTPLPRLFVRSQLSTNVSSLFKQLPDPPIVLHSGLSGHVCVLRIQGSWLKPMLWMHLNPFQTLTHANGTNNADLKELEVLYGHMYELFLVMLVWTNLSTSTKWYSKVSQVFLTKEHHFSDTLLSSFCTQTDIFIFLFFPVLSCPRAGW